MFSIIWSSDLDFNSPMVSFHKNQDEATSNKFLIFPGFSFSTINVAKIASSHPADCPYSL